MEALPELSILLVEDDPLQGERMVMLLQSLGQKVRLAESGEVALDLFAALPSDLVLMDVMLPGIDGFETTRRIKSVSGARWVPVIYMTALGGCANLVEGLHAGGDDYLVKPVEFEILEAKLRSAMRTLGLYRDLEGSRDELTRTNAALREANRELECFTYAVAHDLKSPLRAINGYGSLLASSEAGRLSDDGHSCLEKILEGTERMGLLIDDLLEYSRIERGPTSFEEIYVRDLTAQLLSDFDDEILRTGAAVELAPSCASVVADRSGLMQALRNLLGNALKFSAGVASPHVVIACERHVECCHVSVRDNGIGFDMSYHERIFDIFHRLHRDDEYPGTGIGLAIVRKAVARMQGRCWAESVPGRGASFHLEWPIPSNALSA
ncbi:sensor histidine kinase [Aromatoleum petrolei]|uniref:histidine kinase n=1 Tax=Aromatoleum petrolei TaxID=76116 RepID=A0ABX1MJC6_9RHOO|nr:ATP-binding protein [Aromatoleum petrolei]NMF88043.1 response regulator [Aromatoleum petrolei]QTQ38826.1 Putative two component system sensor histidine kinase [Aromatoleum petrolei]